MEDSVKTTKRVRDPQKRLAQEKIYRQRRKEKWGEVQTIVYVPEKHKSFVQALARFLCRENRRELTGNVVSGEENADN